MTFHGSFRFAFSIATCAVLTVTMVGCAPPVDEIGGSGGATVNGSGGATGTGGSIGTGGTIGTGGSIVGTGGAGTGGAGTGGRGTGGTIGTGGAGTGGRGTGGTTGTGGAGTGGRGTGGAATGGATGGRGGTTGTAGRAGGTGGGAGGTAPATFMQVATILGTSCGTGTCHQGGNHVDLRNTAGLHGRIVGVMPTGTNVAAGCTTMPLVVAGMTTGVLNLKVKAAVTNCGARMPMACSPTSTTPRACLTAAQIATIDAWALAGAPM